VGPHHSLYYQNFDAKPHQYFALHCQVNSTPKAIANSTKKTATFEGYTYRATPQGEACRATPQGEVCRANREGYYRKSKVNTETSSIGSP
jgi:hypothetical protein